jgi:hypothetical protein
MPETCEHLDFNATVSVQRIEDASVWYAEVRIACSVCGQAMRWLGFPMGMSPAEPMTDVTGREARLPFAPYSEEEARRRLLNPDGIGFRVVSRGVPRAG